MPSGKFDSTNQKHYPVLVSEPSSVWNFFARFSDVIWWGNQWQRRQMLALFSALLNIGFVPFFEQKIQELFKDFQGHIPHFSRTPFSAKKEPWVYVFFSSSTTWVILSRRSFCVYSFFFGVLLKLLSYRWNSRTFQHRLQLSRTFKALNFYFKI